MPEWDILNSLEMKLKSMKRQSKKKKYQFLF